MMKILLFTLAAVVLVSGCTQQEQPTFRVGIIESLSGNAAYYGEPNLKGVEIAKEVIAEKYPWLKIEIVHEDSKYTAQGGVEAYRKLQDVQYIDAVITHASPVSLAIQPLARQDGILQMAVSASARTYSSPDDLSFRVSPTTDIEAETISDFLLSKNFSRLSILYMNNDIGLSVTNSVKEKLNQKNPEISIVTEDTFALDNTDFRTQLLKAREKNPDAIFVPSLASHIALILRQAKEINLDVQFLGFRASEDPVLLNAGELAEGFVYSYGFDPSGESGEIKTFSETFKGKYGVKPDGYAAEGYEGLRLVASAFDSCDKNYTCIQAYLQNLRNYSSVFGSLSFDENGDVYYQFFIKKVANGEFVRY